MLRYPLNFPSASRPHVLMLSVFIGETLFLSGERYCTGFISKRFDFYFINHHQSDLFPFVLLDFRVAKAYLSIFSFSNSFLPQHRTHGKRSYKYKAEVALGIDQKTALRTRLSTGTMKLSEKSYLHLVSGQID